MKKIINYITALLFVIVVVSCSDDYLDVNTDIHNPSTVNPQLVLPVAQVYTANEIQNESGGQRMFNTLGNMMMYNWSQSDGFSWYYEEFQYLVTTSFYSQLWNNTYQNALKQYRVLDSYGEEFDNYKAIGKIMESYHFQLLVDAYGDIPYSQALLRGENSFPEYDDAEMIYESLIAELTAAIGLINTAAANTNSVMPEADDIMFNGDMMSWKKFANTLKMRILVRMSGMASKQGYIQDEFDLISSDGYITDDVTANPGYYQAENKQNPFWNTLGSSPNGVKTLSNDATCATDFILDFLTATGDPRIDYLYEEPATGHKGVPQGWNAYPDEYTEEFVSNIGPGLLKGPDQDAVLMPLAEAYFLRAEAVEHGYITGSSQNLYESGITASFNYLGTPNPSAYYGNGMDLVDWTASTNKMETIITQKWLALNGLNGFESWVEYNRTGYPSNLPISELASTADRPVRLFYPASEISSNGLNVPAQPNAFTTKIFWSN